METASDLKSRIRSFLSVIRENFGPIVLFYFAHHFWGLRPAIVVSTVYSFLEIARKLYRRVPMTPLFKFSVVTTLVFGAVDLYAQHSFLFRYEGAVTNIFTGLFFGSSLFSERTVIQEFYERRPNAKPMTQALGAFFRFMTWTWVIYFFAKAAVYFWISTHYELEKGMVLRTAIGSSSLYAMMFINIAGGRRIYVALRELGWLPPETPIPISAPQTT